MVPIGHLLLEPNSPLSLWPRPKAGYALTRRREMLPLGDSSGHFVHLCRRRTLSCGGSCTTPQRIAHQPETKLE